MKDEYFFKYLEDKRFQIGFTVIILFFVIFSASSIRLSNLDLLKDSTTGECIPLALDPFYFMRIAETIVHNGGNLPEFDVMRSPSTNIAWHPEIMPRVIVYFYNISNTFNLDLTIQCVDVISPVIFFIIGTIVFFFLCYVLSKKKTVALAATAILAYSPSYLYRTMAGFSDHEAIGMIAIFSFFLVYALSLKNFEKSWRHTVIYSILSGFMIAFVAATWGGSVTFVLTTMPFAFLMYWLYAKEDSIKSLAFYFILVVSTVLSPLLFSYPIETMINRFVGSYGLLVPFMLMFVLIDFAFSRIRKSGLPNFKEYRAIYSLGASAVVGILGLTIVGKSIFDVISEVWIKLINPFGGTGRVGSTVAENSQPFLTDWIGQSGYFVFWMFVIGVFFVGVNFALKSKKSGGRLLFILGWIAVVSGVLFSRVSSTSLFNGTDFISQAFYVVTLLFFGFVLFLIPTKEKFKVDNSGLLLLSILFFTLINGRSATRVFFLIAPFVSFSAAYATGKLYDYARNSKEEISKVIFWILFTVALVGLSFTVYSHYNAISAQAKYTGPSANAQWQGAMEWVRNNTSEGDVFIHWWDYGYWVQGLGKRATVTDGGHSGQDQADHYIGRYVLTTPEPKSALSYMKTWNVSYLLIDQTDLGKYPAYSKIGGGQSDALDRFSAIPVMPNDVTQTVETSNGTMIVFSGGTYLFEDIVYNDDGKSIFLPSGKAAVVGVIMNIEGNSFKQPEVVYSYNGVYTRIPPRYVYINGELIDFESGLDVIISVIPAFTGNSINPTGAAIYLSQKVSDSLFARLYLLDDAFGQYDTIKLVHAEDDAVVKSLKAQGVDFGDFIYYQGLRGPIKIWEVDYPEDTPVYEEFKEPLDNGYAQFDDEFGIVDISKTLGYSQ